MDSSVRWMDLEKFVDLFLAGRSKKTFPTYDMAFRKIWVHGAEIGKLPFWWSDMDFAGHLVLLNETEASINMINRHNSPLFLAFLGHSVSCSLNTPSLHCFNNTGTNHSL